MFPLSDEQIETFRARGVLRLSGLLPEAVVGPARGAVLRALAAAGFSRAGEWMIEGRRARWPDKGVSAKAIGNRHAEVEVLFDGPEPQAVVAQLLGGAAVDRTVYKRPQVLVTLPNADVWTAPDQFHVDVPRLSDVWCPGVQLFACLDEVVPGGGATVVVVGSHLMLNEGRLMTAREVGRHRVWARLFREVARAEAPLAVTCEVDGMMLSLVELAGAAGDVYAVDLRVLHTAAPNAAARPRLMATDRFVRAAVMPEFLASMGA